MIAYAVIALLNGAVIGTGRAINGQLSAERGAFTASLWNHVVGFVLLTLVLLVLGEWQFDSAAELPVSAYLGGVFGALYVAINSYVFSRLGAMNAVLLVISGQMISAVLLDYRDQHAAPTVTRCLGVVLILVGVYLTRRSTAARGSVTPAADPGSTTLE